MAVCCLAEEKNKSTCEGWPEPETLIVIRHKRGGGERDVPVVDQSEEDAGPSKTDVPLI